MADNIIEPVQEQVQPDIKAELAQQMAISLNGGIPPEPTASTGDNAPTQNANIVPPVDGFAIFKEKFGYDTPETAIKDIEELRAFKSTPIIPEIKFENEESEKLFKAWQAGKKSEVYSFLEQDLRIDKLINAELNKDSAADIVKLGMQLKYKDLTPEEINYKFNKQFALPAKPALLPAEDQEEYDERVKTWEIQITDKQMELMIEAKLAKPELQNSKQKLIFPEIESPADEGYTQYLKALSEGDRLAAEASEEYKKFTPKSIETKINFNDEANKIAFEFQYEPDVEGFAKAVELTSDINLFWKNFTNQDGTPNRQKFLDAIYYANNKDKVLLEAMKQAKNATIKASLPDNSQGGLVRQLPQTQEPNELDKLMRESLKGYGGF